MQYSPTLYLVNFLLVRVEVLQRILFREPDGQWQGLLFALLSVVCIFGWVYIGIVLDGPHNMLLFTLPGGRVGYRRAPAARARV